MTGVITGRDGAERALLGTTVFTGLAAVTGGVLLTIRPDGSLLQAKVAALAGTPFADWRIPGILLATLVGVGGLGAAACLATRVSHARELVCLYAAGLLAFEIVEWSTIGFQPLEAVFGAVAVAILLLGLVSKTVRQRKPASRQAAVLIEA
ncbi:MAG TPA: hypothetical protein VLS53_01375 [Candidatus Dormibacteraeota bacterium]|nr:hypothetical protein [Candidatus Dormibacteraeota bacterium]